MNKMQRQVQDFHQKMGVPIGAYPEALSGERQKLRLGLIQEEALELQDHFLTGNFLEQVDAICDLLYVTFGTAVELGVNIEPFFDEVHKANIRKVGGAVREDGKILKPEGWQPPNHQMVFTLLYDSKIPGYR